MGLEHRKAVEAIPPGLMHPDEKSVLYAVATETNDERLEWAHDRSKLLGILGLRNDQAGEKWLQRRLKALEDAGWITRKAQPRLDGGRWGWGLIRLTFREMGESFSVDQHIDGFKPTPRADDARRPNHVFTPEERAKGYEHGIGRTGGPVESGRVDGLRPPAAGLSESGRVDQLRPTSPDNPEIEPGPPRPLAPNGAEVADSTNLNDDSIPIEERQRASREAARALEAKWSTEESA